MVHLYLIGVFNVIFHVIIFFGSVIALAGLYDHLIHDLSLVLVVVVVASSLLSLLAINNTLKVSHINLRKIKYDLLDNEMDDESKRYHSYIKPYNQPLIIVLIISYLYIVWELYKMIPDVPKGNMLLDEFTSSNKPIRFYFLIGTYVFSSYYFMQVLRLNSLIKKYGLIKNRK